MGAPAVTQQAIERALTAVVTAGLYVTGFTVSKDGTIRVDTKAVDKAAAPEESLRAKKWGERR